MLLAACGGDSSENADAECIKPEGGTGCLDLAPAAKRIDRGKPVFTNPRDITNPLLVPGTLDQVIYGGFVDGKPFRTEFTRLDDVKNIEWNGQTIPAVTWQYLAYSDGRIVEVALDWFAQADDGSVWYLGEDVFNYEDGEVADTHGTWVTGAKAPPAMIMPANPKVGDVYRPENAPPVVFEEVTVKSIRQTVSGPRGAVADAITVTELHADGAHEDKVFAPGYGEFSTGDPDDEHETVSLAVPIDATPGSLPATLMAVNAAVRDSYDAASAARLQQAWFEHRDAAPPILRGQMTRDVDAVMAAAGSPNSAAAARGAALRVAQNNLDLQLQYRPLADIEQDRIALWEHQIVVDSAAGDDAAVAADNAALEWTRKRL